MPGHTDTILHRWFEEVWNRGREESIDELMTESTLFHGLEEGMRGPDSFRPFHRRFRAAFPDVHIVVEDALLDGDMVVARCSVVGTHTGTGLPVPPTGATARFTGMCMARVKDGKIVEGWNNFDFLSLYQQIGMRLS